jgi:hypothetical protein
MFEKLTNKELGIAGVDAMLKIIKYKESDHTDYSTDKMIEFLESLKAIKEIGDEARRRYEKEESPAEKEFKEMVTWAFGTDWEIEVYKDDFLPSKSWKKNHPELPELPIHENKSKLNDLVNVHIAKHYFTRNKCCKA